MAWHPLPGEKVAMADEKNFDHKKSSLSPRIITHRSEECNKRPPLPRGLLSDSEAGGENCKAFFSPSVKTSFCHLPHQREALACCLQHVLNENSISSLRIIYQNMSNGTDEFTILDNR